MSFYLRTLMDANSVNQGCIPLHAAAFKINGINAVDYSKLGFEMREV